MASEVRKSIEKRLKTLRPDLVKRIACDKGKEVAEHEILPRKIRMKVYFYNLYSLWEKGVCENTNFLIRDMQEGNTDFRNLTQSQITRIARLLNERLRQTFGMYTPKDKFKELCAESC